MFSHWQTLDWQIFHFDQMFQYQQIKFVFPIISLTCSGHSIYSLKEVGYSTCATQKNCTIKVQVGRDLSRSLPPLRSKQHPLWLVKVAQVLTQSQPLGMGLHFKKPVLDYLHGEKISPSIHICISIYYMQICLHFLPGKSRFTYADKLHIIWTPYVVSH